MEVDKISDALAKIGKAESGMLGSLIYPAGRKMIGLAEMRVAAMQACLRKIATVTSAIARVEGFGALVGQLTTDAMPPLQAALEAMLEQCSDVRETGLALFGTKSAGLNTRATCCVSEWSKSALACINVYVLKVLTIGA